MKQLESQAYCYDHFRPDLPQEVSSLILDVAIDASQKNTLLDVGTGTGQLISPLLKVFHDIISLEPDKDMMAFAKRKIIPEMPPETSIRFVTSEAEFFTPPIGWKASLVTFLRSFHRFPTKPTLSNLESIIQTKGSIAIVNEAPFWYGQEPWQIICNKMVNQLTSAQNLDTTSEFDPKTNDSLINNLKDSAFSDTYIQEIDVERTWNIEKIIGYLYSTNFAAYKLFDVKANGFERAVQHNLQPYADENGRFTEKQTINVILAKRPS